MTDASQTTVDVGKSGLTPWKIIQTFEFDEWQDFIVEWCDGFDPPYHQVIKLGGSGDKGRDVVAYLGDPQAGSEWDCYQCKNYNKILTPVSVYTELGKLCVYTNRGDFSVPRRYRFMAPCGVSTGLHDLLKSPAEVKRKLIENWGKHCEKKISDVEQFPLTNELRTYIDAFDFSRVWFESPHDILNQHRKTPHWFHRFKSDPPVRDPVLPPPDDVQSHEIPYVSKLMAAYSDFAKEELRAVGDLEATPALKQHFRYSRGYFYSAEALSRFSRDRMLPGTFEGVTQHVFDRVADLVSAPTHASGYHCVLAVTDAAASLALPHSDLAPYVGPADKKGICHQLANDDKLGWV